jgi:trk system potassium uptake protein TrkH
MNKKVVFNITGKIILSEALMLILPLIVSLIYGEKCYISFLITIAIAIVLGGLLTLTTKKRSQIIYAKEGFVIVALSWLALSAIGALPFVISGEIPFFETVSGFTTTGASILNDVESMSRGLLFWRSFTHWGGGMGVLVFILALIPNISDRSIHILRAEVPGPTVGKLMPRIRDTAKILYLIYIFITLLEIFLLFIGGMPLFDSIVHSFGTAGTGGFGIKGDSIAGYSHYSQWVITIFMLLFGINFNLYYLMLAKRFKSVVKNVEVWVYLGLFLVASAIVTINILPIYKNVADAIRLSTFQIATVITTTGFSTADFNTWPGLSKSIMLILMFIGSCAGSTAGGLKISRLVIILKQLKAEFKRLLYPRSVKVIKIDNKKVDDNIVK